MSSLSIALLGSFTAHIDDRDVDNFYTAKARALLAYLAIEGTRPLDRAHLAEVFWPDRLEESARGSLRHALSNLRKVIGDKEAEVPYLLLTRRTVQLNPDALEVGAFTVDVARFQTLYKQASSDMQAAQEAIALYRGPFFDNDLCIDSPEFDAWAQLQREILHRQMAELLTSVHQQMMEADDVTQAITYAQMLVEHEPWSEEAHVLLMNTLWQNGQGDVAMSQYEQCRRLLREELDVEPSPETVMLYEAIRDNRRKFQKKRTIRALEEQTIAYVQQEPKEVELQKTQEKNPPVRHNLPPRLKPFFGREGELAKIAEHLARPNCRQLTVFGPGGMGKTELVLEYAQREMNHFADGVWFVSLDGVTDEEQVPAVIANSLGVPMTPDLSPLASLCQFLRDRSLLLILDNFEHLRESVLLIPELLNRAPRITLLVTSRERLNLQMETVFILGGLDLPVFTSAETKSAEKVEESSAFALFVDRAQRANVSFMPTDDSRAAIVEICHLVDGIPLGIELAAVWTRLLSCREILLYLRQSIDLLTVSMPDLPPRHRCMRTLFEESWQSLSTEAQQLFAQVSILRDGCDLRAIQQAANATLHQIAELIDRGFLRRMSDGRYQIHKLMRQLALSS